VYATEQVYFFESNQVPLAWIECKVGVPYMRVGVEVMLVTVLSPRILDCRIAFAKLLRLRPVSIKLDTGPLKRCSNFPREDAATKRSRPI